MNGTIKEIYRRRHEQKRIVETGRLTNEEREWFDPFKPETIVLSRKQYLSIEKSK